MWRCVILRCMEVEGMEQYLTVDDVAVMLKATPYTVRRWLREGTLPGTHVGKEWRVSETALARHLEQQTPAAPKAAADIDARVAALEADVARLSDKPSKAASKPKARKPRAPKKKAPAAVGCGSCRRERELWTLGRFKGNACRRCGRAFE